MYYLLVLCLYFVLLISGKVEEMEVEVEEYPMQPVLN